MAKRIFVDRRADRIGCIKEVLKHAKDPESVRKFEKKLEKIRKSVKSGSMKIIN
jgi:hypothetical protein